MTRTGVANASTLSGVAVLAACACGAGGGLVRALSGRGVHLQDAVLFGASCGIDHSLQSAFVGVGLVLILIGFSLRSFTSATLAAIGCTAIAFGSLTARPNMMSVGKVPHQDPVLVGFITYAVGAAFLIAAFMQVYRFKKPLAAGAAMSGMALATGCSCCLVTGAVTALLANAGLMWVYRLPGTPPPVFFAGAALAAAGLYRLAGARPAVLMLAGSVLSFGGTRFLMWAAPNVIFFNINFSFVPIYLVYLVAAAIMLRGFVLTYQVAGVPSAVEQDVPAGTAVPAEGV